MTTISSTDNVFAVAHREGREIFNFAGKGFTGIPDIVTRIRRGNPTLGMVTLTVRNSSRGWSQTRSIYLA